MNFALHAIKRARALINDQARYALLATRLPAVGAIADCSFAMSIPQEREKERESIRAIINNIGRLWIHANRSERSSNPELMLQFRALHFRLCHCSLPAANCDDAIDKFYQGNQSFMNF